MTAASSSRFAQWRDTTLAPFQHRVFAFFWWASLVSSFGSLIQTVGASWLMATIAPSANMVALVQTAGALPFFFLSLIAGAYADTHDRRLVMLTSVWLMFLASGALAGLAISGSVTPQVLLLMTFLIGCGTAAFAPAWQAAIADQVPRKEIAAAVMANAMGFNLARSVGPAIGGLIVAAAGAAAAFVINAFSYIGMLATLYWWRSPKVASNLPPEPLGSAIATGIRYVRLSPHIESILLRAVLFAVPISAVPALMPVVARDLLGGGAPTYGVLLGGFGIGAMLGALSSAALRARYSSDRLLRDLCGVAAVGMLAIALSPYAWLSLLAHVLCGATWTLGLANFNIAVQLSSPRWVTGRTLALYQTFAFAGMAVGAWVWGEVAVATGLRQGLAIAALFSLTTLFVARWLPVSIAQAGSLDPHGVAGLGPTAVALDPASGPIVVTIEYRVKPGRAADFLGRIHELGRIRQRDGARRWSVCQDLDQPDLWLERFESPTWTDYQRRLTRPTLGDQTIREQLKELVMDERGTARRLIERPSGSQPLGQMAQRTEPLDDTSAHG
jgi:MFS family permease